MNTVNQSAARTGHSTETTTDSIERSNSSDRSIVQVDFEVVTPAEFLIRKERDHRYVVGVVGFTAEWCEKKLASNHILKEQNRFARGELEGLIRDLQEQHGEKLLISTGPSREGVAKLANEICGELGIEVVAIGSQGSIASYHSGLRYLVVACPNEAAESSAFLATADSVVLLGGSELAKKTAILAANDEKPVVVIQGFGGAADELRGNIIKALKQPDSLEAQIKEGRINATFIDCGRPVARSRDLT